MDEGLYSPGDLFTELRSGAGLQADHADVSGAVDEEQMLQLIAYVKSLGLQERTNGK